MKNNKLFLPAIILIIAIFVIAVYSFISSIAQKPTVTDGEFPFSITYELDGETVTIEDVYRVHYDRNDGYADTKSRIYIGEIGDMGEGNTSYILKKDNDGRIELYTNFYADYMMGDTEYTYFDDETFSPQIFFYDTEEQEFGDVETLSAHNVKLISFEYPTPIENSLVFSHISYLSGEIVFLTLVISLLSLFTIIIFVRKEKDLKYKAVDIISMILNFIITFIFIPFVTIAAILIDIEGGGPEFYYQALYFIPSLSVLCIGASVALRRKGYGIKALISLFIGPVLFLLYLIICGVLGAF